MVRKQKEGHFDKVAADLDQVQNAKLTLRRVHTEDKVEGGVVSVNQLVVRATDETENRSKYHLKGKSMLCVKR